MPNQDQKKKEKSFYITRQDILNIAGYNYKDTQTLFNYISNKIGDSGFLSSVTFIPKYYDLERAIREIKPTANSFSITWYNKRIKEFKRLIKQLTPVKDKLQYYKCHKEEL